MKSTYLVLRIVAALPLFPLLQSSAEVPVTFKVMATFDYPGFTDTSAYKINNDGYVAGSVYNEDTMISNPHGYPFWTGVYGINNPRQMCGSYEGGAKPGDGFLLSHHNFITADFPGAFYNDVLDLNDAGSFCGDHSTGGAYSGFVNIGGAYITFQVPGTTLTAAVGINNRNQCVGYYYTDTEEHGFFRDADGTMTYPID